jgi:hypothetical protein
MLSLSYVLRVLCVASLGMGATHVLCSLTLWTALPGCIRVLEGKRARMQERLFFGLMLLPPLVAFLATVLLIVPSFVSQETNHMSENTGVICILVSAAVWVWYGASFARAIFLVSKTNAFERSLQSSATTAALSGHRLSGHSETWVVASDRPLLALVGILRPRILLSQRLLDSSSLEPAALEVALDHEDAHARHYDNGKLLILSMLPRLPFGSARMPSCEHLWRRYAEWAADDEAVAGSPERALLLAETLMLFARSSTLPPRNAIAMGLAAPDVELSARIQRILAVARPGESGTGQMSSRAFVALCLFTAASLATLIAIPFLHDAAEYLLHLG